MRMNMSDFATFFAVARNQSFRAAGDELGLSSSAISHSIKTLEQRLKIRLFNRTTRSVSLTEAGSNLYERLRPAFDEIQIRFSSDTDRNAQNQCRPGSCTYIFNAFTGWFHT